MKWIKPLINLFNTIAKYIPGPFIGIPWASILKSLPIIKEKGLYDTRPLRSLVTSVVNEPWKKTAKNSYGSDRHFHVLISDMQKGK